MMNEIRVGLSEHKVVSQPAVLACYGLGSCVAVVLFDKVRKIGGLAHVMLPTSFLNKNEKKKAKPAKFADTAVACLMHEMVQLGAQVRATEAKIFGGSCMLPEITGDGPESLGRRNVAAVELALKEQRIRLVAADTGKNHGRTIFFSSVDGSVVLKRVHGELTYF